MHVQLVVLHHVVHHPPCTSSSHRPRVRRLVGAVGSLHRLLRWIRAGPQHPAVRTASCADVLTEHGAWKESL